MSPVHPFLALSLLLGASASAAHAEKPLAFGWPGHASADVRMTDERTVGDSRRSTTLAMRLTVAPGEDGQGLVVRFPAARIVSIDGKPAAQADPASDALLVARVLGLAIPDMAVSTDGRYVGSLEIERVVRRVMNAVGLPPLPMGEDTFAEMLSDTARQDWDAWVGAWIGLSLAPGEEKQARSRREIGGKLVPVAMTWRRLGPGGAPGRSRYQAVAVYPSEAVREYTSGFLIDMAREAKELGDDPIASRKFLDSARYSALTETLTIELETVTLLPIRVERLRTFSADAGRHHVEGRERRLHEFAWK